MRTKAALLVLGVVALASCGGEADNGAERATTSASDADSSALHEVTAGSAAER